MVLSSNACALHSFDSGDDMDFTDWETDGQVLAEYVWMGGSGTDLRSRTKVLDARPSCPEDCPVISVDGSLCGQGTESACEVFLKPRKIFRDPFRKGDHLIVLCDTFQLTEDASEPAPHSSNNRVHCEAVQQAAADSEAMYAAEQDFMMLDPTSGLPLGFINSLDTPAPAQKPFFCGTGPSVAAGRKLAEAHLQACLHAGLKMGGYNAGAAAGVWSYKLGPCSGIEFADQLWTSRYLLTRVSEGGGVCISFDPYHADSAIQLSCKVKYSTKDTRNSAVGLMMLQQQVARLEASHMQHMMAYGRGNIGSALAHSSPETIQFSCSTGGKSAIMIPTKTVMQKAGYLVDRRPAANMDPYMVSTLLLASTLGMPLPMPAAKPQQPAQQAPAAAEEVFFPAAKRMHCSAPVQMPKASQQASYRSHCAGLSHPTCIPTPNVSAMASPAGVMSFTTMQQLMALQMQQRMSAFGGMSSMMRPAASPSPSCSWNSGDSGDASTLNSQDVLIDELDKFDKLSPLTPPKGIALSYAVESSDESSDGTSPETHVGPLSAAVREELMW